MGRPRSRIRARSGPASWFENVVRWVRGTRYRRPRRIIHVSARRVKGYSYKRGRKRISVKGYRVAAYHYERKAKWISIPRHKIAIAKKRKPPKKYRKPVKRKPPKKREVAARPPGIPVSKWVSARSYLEPLLKHYKIPWTAWEHAAVRAGEVLRRFDPKMVRPSLQLVYDEDLNRDRLGYTKDWYERAYAIDQGYVWIVVKGPRKMMHVPTVGRFIGGSPGAKAGEGVRPSWEELEAMKPRKVAPDTNWLLGLPVTWGGIKSTEFLKHAGTREVNDFLNPVQWYAWLNRRTKQRGTLVWRALVYFYADRLKEPLKPVALVCWTAPFTMTLPELKREKME